MRLGSAGGCRRERVKITKRLDKERARAGYGECDHESHIPAFDFMNGALGKGKEESLAC